MRRYPQTTKMPEVENHVINNTTPEVKKGKVGAYEKYSHFNSTFTDLYGAEVPLKEYLGKTGKNIKVTPPFRFRDGHYLSIGDDVKIGAWTFLGDGGALEIGNGAILGPRVQVHTIHHDLKPEKRSYVYKEDIKIGADAVIGGGAMVLVSVGDGAIIVPGSVVIKDIPAGAVAVGNPARVVEGEEAEFYKRKLMGIDLSNGSREQEVAAYRRLKQFNESRDSLENAETSLAEVIGGDRVGKDIKVVPPVYLDSKTEILLGDRVILDVGVIVSGRGKVQIGESSLVGPYGQIYTNNGQDVEIGKGAWMGGGSILLPGVKVGDGAIIVPGSVVIKDIPAGAVAVGNPARVVEGEEAEVYKKKLLSYRGGDSKEEEIAAFEAFKEFNATFNQLYNAEVALVNILGQERVGKDIKIVPPLYCLDRNQVIESGVHLNGGIVLRGQSDIGERVLIGPYTQIYGATLEDDVWIGGSVIIMPGVTVGKGAAIGAGSVVTEDIPENVVAVGNRVRVIRKIE